MNSGARAIMQESAQLRATTRRLIAESHQITDELYEAHAHLVNDLKAAREAQRLAPLNIAFRW